MLVLQIIAVLVYVAIHYITCIHLLHLLSIFAGVLSLQHSLKQHCTVRRMLREKLQAAQAGKLQADKEHAHAAALAATYHHDLELLKHEVIGRQCYCCCGKGIERYLCCNMGCLAGSGTTAIREKSSGTAAQTQSTPSKHAACSGRLPSCCYLAALQAMMALCVS